MTGGAEDIEDGHPTMYEVVLYMARKASSRLTRQETRGDALEDGKQHGLQQKGGLEQTTSRWRGTSQGVVKSGAHGEEPPKATGGPEYKIWASRGQAAGRGRPPGKPETRAEDE